MRSGTAAVSIAVQTIQTDIDNFGVMELNTDKWVLYRSQTHLKVMVRRVITRKDT